ncbi:MAG: hypothetical protein NWR69_05220, partial [Flavobacteriales bacterium]|nr:hypothetical protein [Flavobacteriales bacterium]
MKNRIKNFFPSLPIFLTSLTFFAASIASAQIPSTGLVGYWPFNGNANDESGNGNNGTVNGATLTTDRFGNANSAYSFDGVNDWIETLTNNISNNQGFTFSLWLKPESLAGNEDYLIQIGNDPGTRYFGFRVQGNGYPSRLACEFRAGGNYQFVSVSPNENAVVGINNYYMGTVTYDNQGNLKIYLNGQIVSETNLQTDLSGLNSLSSLGGTFDFTSNPMKIGAALPSGYWFDGDLDDIGIWNRALTPAEITQLYTDQTSLVEVPCTPFLGEDQTVCAGTSVILEAGQSSYSIGQTGPAGGIIFHTQQNANGVTQVFEAAPSDIGNVMWGCAGFVMNQTSAAIGSGQQNTNAIISACGNSTAAALCANYTLNGADDWYLPSINELGLVFQNLWANGMGNFNAPNGQYWSSTENSSAGSMIVSIEGALPPNYAVTEDNKSFTDYIRPCRSFTVANNTYLWSTGATTATINVTPTTTTTYTCAVTDANGNSCTDSVTVFVPQIEATDLTICAGETTT